MVCGVERFQVFDLALGILVQRIVGRAHMGEQCVASFRRKRARDQDRSHGRNLIVAVIGVPGTAILVCCSAAFRTTAISG